ncbi:endoribonuclease YbeY isoform 2-T2 [Discoglossus pictus]
MSLIVRSAQRLVPLRRAVLRLHLQIARKLLNVQHFDLGVICVSSARMQHINRVYRGQDTPTDVLSFPFHEDLVPGVPPVPSFRDEYNLGDIYLGVEFIYQQCQEAQEECSGVLTMFEKEKQILTEINRLTGSSLRPLTTNSLQPLPH